MIDDLSSLYGSFLTEEDLRKLLDVACGSFHETDELVGYLFGLSLIPEHMAIEEWLPGPLKEKMRIWYPETHGGFLSSLLECLRGLNNNGKLLCPFDFTETLAREEWLLQVRHVFPWTFGLWQALKLRYEFFWPDQEPDIDDDKAMNDYSERYVCLRTIQGIAEPEAYLDELASADPDKERDDETLMAVTLSILYGAVSHMQKIGLSASPKSC